MSLEVAIEQLITSKEVHLVHLLPQLLLGGLHLLQQHPVAHLTSSKAASHELLDFAVYSEPLDHTCKKRGIAGIYPRNFFWIFRKILG